MPKFKCRSLHCNFYINGRCTAESIMLNEQGLCETYKAGFTYCFYYCCEHMQTNFITYMEINKHPEFKYSIYYMQKCLPIKCCHDDIRGMLVIYDKEMKNPLNAEDLLVLIENQLDEEALGDCVDEFIKNGLPETKNTQTKSTDNTAEKDYGWLSPDGRFYPSEWGTHEQSAQKLCQGLIEEEVKPPYCDELTKRGWALIHNPSLSNCVVTNNKPLTKKQKDFLYSYFKSIGMTSRAELYQNEDGS